MVQIYYVFYLLSSEINKMIRDYNYLFKVVLVGNSSVGKSSLLRRFADDSFQESYLATIGVDFRFKSITVSGDIVKLQIWDTAGQERFRTITGAYYKGAHAIIVVYDITNEISFIDIEEFWLQQIEKHAIPEVKIFILGNKVDEEEKRKVSEEEVKAFGERKKFNVESVSAKSGDGVGQAFYNVAEKLTKLYPKQEKQNSKNPVIEEIEKKKKEFQLQSGANTTTKNNTCC